MKIRLLVLGASLTAALAAGLWIRRERGPVQTAPCTDCRLGPRPAAPPAETEAGQERLGPAKPGEWRHSFKEPAQSFEAYAASDVNRRCAHRTTIYLQLLESKKGSPPFSPRCEAAYPQVIERMRVYLEAFFGVSVKLAPPIPMFEEAFVEDRDQYDAHVVTDRLAARVPADALALIGLTRDDLFSPGLNYVFGVGSLGARAGAYSLRRLQTDDGLLFLMRALKLVVHETGHIFSIHHCTEWRCVMQGANSVVEQDGQPLRLCPVDLRKLEWNVGGGRRERYAGLLDLHRSWGFKDEAAWIEKRLAAE